MNEFIIFSGSANLELADKVAKNLNLHLGKAKIDRFSDGETTVEINENVRGKHVFILQPTCQPTNDNLMELLLMSDALKRSSAARVTAVIPYFGYARQDRRPRSARVAISAKVIANMLQMSGINHILMMDVHADQVQGFFDIPVDNIYASPVLLNDIKSRLYGDLVVASPDVGGVVRARAFAKRLGCPMVIIDKRRNRPNESEVMHLIGDVAKSLCVITDDIVDTAGTLTHAAAALKDKGATKVYAYCTHAVLSGDAIEKIQNSALDGLVVTDTIPLSVDAQQCSKISQVSCAPLLAETIRRIVSGNSLLELFAE